MLNALILHTTLSEAIANYSGINPEKEFPKEKLAKLNVLIFDSCSLGKGIFSKTERRFAKTWGADIQGDRLYFS